MKFQEKVYEEVFAQEWDEEIGDMVETDVLSSKELDVKILSDDMTEELGYMTLFEYYDEDGNVDVLYVATIEIYEPYRNCGHGSSTLKQLAKKYGQVYLCPTDEDNERLYARLGEEVEYRHAPDCLKGCFDTWGTMYVIER